MDIPTQRKTAKAEAILQSDGIEEITDARTFAVKGATDIYLVIVADRGTWCSCPSTDPACSHVLAVNQTLTQPDDPFAGLGTDNQDWSR